MTIADVMDFLRKHHHQGEDLRETLWRLAIPEAMAACYGPSQCVKAAAALGISPRQLSYYLHGNKISPALVEVPIWRKRFAGAAKSFAANGGGGAAEGSGKTPPVLVSSASSKERS